jgi:hypothetical protein
LQRQNEATFTASQMDYEEVQSRSLALQRHASRFVETPELKPINIKAHQRDCARRFGYGFDFRFCKIPQSKSPLRRHAYPQPPDLIPRLETVLGLSAFSEQFIARKRRNEERQADSDMDAELEKLFTDEIKTKLRKHVEECGIDKAVENVGVELLE